MSTVSLATAKGGGMQAWPPLHAWSRRRRAGVTALIAAVACVIALGAVIRTDFSGLGASEAALAARRRELNDARRLIEQLPQLRREAAAEASERPSVPRSSADDIRDLSELAVRAGITLISLEPTGTAGSGIEAARSLKLVGQADFAAVRRLFASLRGLPILVVPSDVAISRGGASLSLTATLLVFDRLRPPLRLYRAESTLADTPQTDPFGLPDDVDGGGLRLAGVIVDRSHAVAMIETPDGITAVGQGQQLGPEHVGHIDLAAVALSRPPRMRKLTWERESP